MEKYSVREVVEQAVQTEKLGNEFYASMAAKFSQNEKLKKLFDMLAGEELKHEKTFAGLKDRLGKELLENWEEASLYLRAIVESEYFLGKNKALPSMEALQTVDEAVRFAIRFEKETLLYYHGIRDAVTNKEILDEIIKEEKKHILRLIEYKNLNS